MFSRGKPANVHDGSQSDWLHELSLMHVPSWHLRKMSWRGKSDQRSSRLSVRLRTVVLEQHLLHRQRVVDAPAQLVAGALRRMREGQVQREGGLDGETGLRRWVSGRSRAATQRVGGAARGDSR
jgi:hypothetical protein